MKCLCYCSTRDGTLSTTIEQWLFSLDLKEFNEGAVTTLFGREFHTSYTRLEDTLAFTFSCERRLKIFRLLCSLFGSVLSIWLNILYNSTTSALKSILIC